MWKFLDEALSKEAEFCVRVGYSCCHETDCFLNTDELLIEKFISEVGRSNRGSKEAKSLCEFNWDSRPVAVSSVGFSGVSCDGV